MLDKVVAWRGKTQDIRCDNGPALIAGVLAEGATQKRHRDSVYPARQAQQLNQALQQRWKVYNQIRPHSTIDYLTPDAFEYNTSTKLDHSLS
ncbi:MAG: hypothetical protein OHK0039_34540 [Bacteroidia bacterium]